MVEHAEPTEGTERQPMTTAHPGRYGRLRDNSARSAMSRLVDHVADQLPPAEPPDRSVVRIVWAGLDADYLERDDTAASEAGDTLGQHWYPAGDRLDEPMCWDAVVRSSAGGRIEVLAVVPAPASDDEVERRARILRAKLEDIIGEAYEIGYAHGGNAYRLAKKEEPHRVHDGWAPLVDQAVAAVGQRRPVANGLFGPGIFGTGIDLSALDEDTASRLGAFYGEQLAAAERAGRAAAHTELLGVAAEYDRNDDDWPPGAAVRKAAARIAPNPAQPTAGGA